MYTHTHTHTHKIVTRIADRNVFLSTTSLGRIKTWQCAKPRPLRRIGNREQIFRHSSEYLDAFLSFPDLRYSSPHPRPLVARFAIRIPGANACVRVGISVTSVNVGAFDIKECAPCRMSPFDEAEPPSCIPPPPPRIPSRCDQRTP